MNIEPHTRAGRFFIAMAGIHDAFLGEHRLSDRVSGQMQIDGTNACQLVRTLSIVLFALLLHVSVGVLVLVTFIALPIYHYGIGSYITFLACIGVLVSLILLRRYWVAKRAVSEKKSKRPVVKKKSTPSTFGALDVVKVYWQGFNSKFCLRITFNTNKEEDKK